MSVLSQKNILIGITGGIAAYKIPDLVRKLKQQGANVKVVMTEGAQAFITPLTLQAISGEPVRTTLFDEQAEAAMGHIELARWADLIVVAPASADFIAKLAHGQADDLLSTLCLASLAKKVIAPAMNEKMWAAETTQQNIEILKKHQMILIGPAYGEQACGDVGLGRMIEPQDILTEIQKIFVNDKLAGVKVTITAGPTQEALDPVRYLSNHSSGKMGYALAEALKLAGADVTLITGPVSLVPPDKIKLVPIVSADDMLTAVLKDITACDIFIAVAAVADYKPAVAKATKIEKNSDEISLTLVKTPDILQTVANLPHKPFCIGFAAQTDNLIEKASQKRKRKNVDVMVANAVGLPDQGFASDNNAVTVLTKAENIALPLMSKTQLATKLVEMFILYYRGNDEKNRVKNSG